MSLIQKIPNNSRPRFPVNGFESDVFAAGVYEFENAANTDQVIIANLNPAHIYVIALVSAFANVPESAWLEGMLMPADFPRFHLRLEKSKNHSIFPEPFRMANYVDNQELLIYFPVQAPNDRLLGTFFGRLGQPSQLVGVNTVQAQISMTIYEIIDAGWVQKFRTDASTPFKLEG